MKTYTVKQIAIMLNTQPETVRRWIRTGKLEAKKSSKKDGHIITEDNLNIFLNQSPKYAALATGLMLSAVATPFSAIPLVSSIAATYLATSKKKKSDKYDILSKEEVKNYLQKELEIKNKSIDQKIKFIEHLKKEIELEQQQIANCNFMLNQLEREEK